MFTNKKPNKKAFTLIEILIVVVIVGILSTLAIVSLQNSRAKSRDAKRIANLKQIQTALEVYYYNYKKYPETLEELISSTTLVKSLTQIPIAPTPADGECTNSSNNYNYVVSLDKFSYTISSCLGADVNSLKKGKIAISPEGLNKYVYSGPPCSVNPEGCSWQVVGSPGFSSGKLSNVFIENYNNNPYVIYNDDSDWRPIIKEFNGSIWENYISIESFDYWVAGYEFYNGEYYKAYVSYDDFYDEYCGDWCYSCKTKINVEKFNKTNWVFIGSTDLFDDYFPYVFLNMPYIYQINEDHGQCPAANNVNKISVSKFNGSDFLLVGSANFTNEASNPSFDVYNDTPYLSYTDHGVNNYLSVKKFNGSSWVSVGNLGFSNEVVYDTKIKIYNGVPYVAYINSRGGITVKKFDGSNWINVGLPSFSNVVSYIQLQIYGGIPYVAFQDGNFSYKLTVKKFDGTNWVNVGIPGFSLGNAYSISFKIFNNIPYVAFKDGGSSHKLTVMKFDRD